MSPGRNLSSTDAHARTRWLAVCAGLASIALAYAQGEGYKDRLAAPRGNHLVAAGQDGPAAVAPRSALRPRHLILIVVDGLRADAASSMRAADWMKAHGTCRRTDVGTLTMSRPVYALLSSGVEPARSGVRTNDQRKPAPVDSIWQVARRAGLRVTATSTIPWWRELFPDGFDEYRLESPADNMFQETPDGDLALLHPVFVDDAGHEHGAASPRYREAVLRADTEMLSLLATLDLTRDTVVMTADHGHTDAGGHGSGAPELRNVLTCMAGVGVRHGPSLLAPAIDARALPALLSILAWLPLPRHLFIDHQDFEALLAVLDPAVIPPDRVALYQREVDARQITADAQLSSWLGKPHASWAELVRHERYAQLTGFASAIAGGLLLLLAVAWRRHRSLTGALAAVGWAALVLTGFYAATRLTRGAFDLAAVRTRVSFVAESLLSFTLVLAATGALHLWRWRDPDRLLFDGVLLAGAQLVLALAHLAGFGLRLGFPLPPPALLFLPYPLAISMAATGAALLATVAVSALLARRAGQVSGKAIT